MNDILFGNNNHYIIKRLSGKNFSINKRRNIVEIIAIALTAFMITSVFSIGFSYFETYQLQQTRMMGTIADVAITSPTEQQLEQLKQSPLISDLGILQRLGSIDTSRMENASLGLVWLSDTEWSAHRLPAVSNVQGAYPVSQNEMMLPTWALEQMGITDPQIGMEIPLSCQLEHERQYTIDEFVLSGYYTDYMFIRTDHRGSAYVSEAFRKSAKIPLESGGSAMIRFSEGGTALNCDKLKEEIQFGAQQEFEIVPSSEADGSGIMIVIVLLAALTSLSGYLLIYNILYISVSRDIRFYGQLKTIGTTKKQIKRIVRTQVLKTSAIGIPAGLLSGAAVSFVVVPYSLNMMYSGNAGIGTKISFSPLIFAGASLFTFFTVMIGSMKPAGIAGSISPIAALRYVEDDNTGRANKKRIHGTKLSHMAWQNVFRSKKSAMLVFTSLSLGLCLFLVTTGILSGLSPENFASQWGESAFALTYSIHEDGTPISDKMVSEIEQIEGVQDMRFTYAALPRVTMPVKYDEAVFGKYLKSLNGKGGLDLTLPESQTAYTQNFFSGVYGIDRAYVEELNQTLKNPIDMAAFERGEIVVLSELTDQEGNALIQPGQNITIDIQDGTYTFSVAEGVLPADFQSGRGNERGTAPDLYISEKALRNLSAQCRVFRIAFNTADGQDKEVLQQLKTITASNPGIDILSRYEKQEEMSSYIVISKVLGMGLSAILLLIGVINFINTMVVNVNTRRHELAVLESIGMTKRQIMGALVYEGGYYWGISFAIVITFGSAIYAFLYIAFKRLVPYAIFSYPTVPLVLIAGIVLVICIVVPVWTYKMDMKGSIVNRLNISE